MAQRPIPPSQTPGMDVYHGGPKPITKFELAYVGDGQGAQTYGWGLYFAEHLDVARTYRMPQGCLAHQQLIQEGDAIQTDAERIGLKMVTDFEAHAAKFIGGTVPPELQTRLDDHNRKFLGHVYAVHLDVSPKELLEWDLPLTQQSEFVRDAIEKAAHSEIALQHAIETQMTGKQLYMALAMCLATEAADRPAATQWADSPAARKASEFLACIGIIGLTYADGFSRGKGKGTKNIVLFDPARAHIVRELSVKEFLGTA